MDELLVSYHQSCCWCVTEAGRPPLSLMFRESGRGRESEVEVIGSFRGESEVTRQQAAGRGR